MLAFRVLRTNPSWWLAHAPIEDAQEACQGETAVLCRLHYSNTECICIHVGLTSALQLVLDIDFAFKV